MRSLLKRGTLQQPAESGTYALRANATISLLGDSITSAGGLGSTDPTWGTDANLYQSPFGWIVWALDALSQRLTLVRNAGVSGNTTAQMLARVSDVLQDSPTYCTVMGGRNDIDSTTVSNATIIANLQAICAALLAVGIRPVLCTILPCSTETAAQIAAREAINTALIAYAKTTRGIILCDWAPVWTDAATGKPLTSPAVTTDGKHPNRDGATRLGYALANALSPHVGGTSDLVYWNGDSRSLGQNPCLTGTAGGKGTGVTGSVADGWTVAPSSSTLTAVCSKVARTDGIPGEWQQIAMSVGGPLQMYFTGYTTSKNVLWTPGVTKFYVECEFERDADWNTGTTRFGMQSFIAGQANGVYASMDFAGGAHGAGSILPTKGVLRSPVALFNASATGVGVGVKWENGTGTLRLGRIAVRAAA